MLIYPQTFVKRLFEKFFTIYALGFGTLEKNGRCLRNMEGVFLVILKSGYLHCTEASALCWVAVKYLFKKNKKWKSYLT